MTIETTESSTRGKESQYMTRKDRPTDPTEIQRSIEEAIQDLVRMGLVVDSGQKRWSPRTGRYEIVWESTVFGKTFH
jgi:predicted Zn-dependent protease